MASWAQHITKGNLTVKHVRASEAQAKLMAMIATRTRAKGGDLTSAAGAIAVAITESKVENNLRQEDHDSVGIFQQRVRYYGYGTASDPVKATDAFLSGGPGLGQGFLGWRKQGLDWLSAAHKVQGSAFPRAPAQWWEEALRAARYFLGVGGTHLEIGTVSGSDTATRTKTRVKPYEFSRGSPSGEREDTITATGRLAEEVGFRRFMRRGAFWFVSDEWLISQKPRYRFRAGARGVLSIEHSFETRRRAAEATVRAVLGRYRCAVGDCVALAGEGPANGNWVVSGTRRDGHSPVLELSLVRAQPKLAEPAPETEQVTVNVARGTRASTQISLGGTPDDDSLAARMYAAAELYTSWHASYDQDRRHGLTNGPFRFGDCSSGVSWVLWKAGAPLPPGASAAWAPSTHAYPSWGRIGHGQKATVMVAYQSHIWILWHGCHAKRFDTGNGLAPHQQFSPRSSAGFVPKFVEGM